VARQAAADRGAWDALLDASPLDPRPDPDGISVDSEVLRAYDSRLGSALIRAAGRRVGLSLGTGRAGRILDLARRGRSGTKLELGGGWSACLDFDRLTLARDVRAVPAQAVLEGPSGSAQVGRWTLRWRVETAPSRQERASRAAWVLPARYEIHTWRAGDLVRPLGGVGRRLVVRCMQDRQVPRRERAGWPVITHERVVVWVPGVCRADVQVPADGVEALRIDAERT
jgi:tRNA(Ile)-lysidine synthetase-like protein